MLLWYCSPSHLALYIHTECIIFILFILYHIYFIIGNICDAR